MKKPPDASTHARLLAPVGAVHVPDPLMLKVPALHGTPTSPVAPLKKLGAHSQLLSPSTDTEFIGQSVHVAVPMMFLNVPDLHATQSSPTPASPM